MSRLMIYGATGYTGALIAERAVAAGLDPVLAGRSGAKIRALADRLGAEQRVFSLEDPAALAEGLGGIDVVLHAAGPFKFTGPPMIDACLASGCHYLDITGEMPIFARCAGLDDAATAAGVTLLPGCGFDVVPTDCVAAMLKDRLPDATELRLAFGGMTVISRGTRKTAALYIADGVKVRRGGEVTTRKGQPTALVDFGDGPERVIATTWGDVETAWFSTGIPDIEVFMVPPRGTETVAAIPPWLRRLIRTPLAKPFLRRWQGKGLPGPTAQMRRTAEARVYGRARDADGGEVEIRLRTPEGYELTAITAVDIAARVLRGEVAPGFRTPSQALGADYILTIPGARLLEDAG